MDTKYCKRCDQTLDKVCFTSARNRYDGLQAYCSECMKTYRREHYYANKQAHYDRNKKTELKLIEWVHSYKSSRSCKDCEISYPKEPWLLEFDHLDASLKESNISALIKCGSFKRLQAEIEKCDLVCVLCHRRRTAKRAGYYLRTSDG